jgi:hypothetical protein
MHRSRNESAGTYWNFLYDFRNTIYRSCLSDFAESTGIACTVYFDKRDSNSPSMWFGIDNYEVHIRTLEDGT